MITGEIGWDVDSGMFARALAAPDIADATTLYVSLNSIGGDVFDGIGIYNALIGHGAQVIMTVTGLAASIASVIMMAGDKVIMGRGAEVMIHDAHAVQIGNAADMAKMSEILDKASNNIASFYAERAGGTADEWRAVMRDERWYSAQEAVDAGLADEVAPVRERVTGDAAAITLAARAPRTGRLAAKATQALGDDVTSENDQNSTDDTGMGGFLAGLGDDLRQAYGPPADEPIADLGDAIRSAVAFAATTVSEPKTTPASDSLPELTSDHLADIRRAVQGE
jgi:ATP-dependent protease ClpP protease subunit